MKSNLALCLRGTIDTVFILRRLQEEYHAKGKNVYVFCGPREILTVPSKMLEWAIRKKEIPEVLIRSVMSLYEGAKNKSQSGF